MINGHIDEPKGMTDNEIIKALECCVSSKHICHHTCPMLENEECLSSLRKNALDLINRQKAEIERFDRTVKEYAYLYDKHINTPFNHIKAEAVKEFALELKRIPRIAVYKNEIDNLLKEMVGEDK